MFKKILAAVALTAGLLLAAPTTANAVGYTDGAQCGFDVSVVKAGATSTLLCVPGTWSAGETIDWTVTGPDDPGFARAAGIRLHYATRANADGSDVLRFTLPPGASGRYSVVGVGQSSRHECATTVTVLPPDRVSAAVDPGGTHALADTGSVVAVSAAWAGGGLVVLGAIALAVVALIRRPKRTT
jgi:hypothetical protein